MTNAIISALQTYSNKSVYYPVLASIIAQTYNNPEIFEYDAFGEETKIREFKGANAIDYDEYTGFEEGVGGQAKWVGFKPQFDRQVPLRVPALKEIYAIQQGMPLSGEGILKASYQNLGAEMDAVSFASIVGFTPAENISEEGDSWSETNAFNTLLDIEAKLFNAEVSGPAFVYITASKFPNVTKSLMNNNLAANPKILEFVAGDGLVVKVEIVRYNNLILVKVPDSRFFTEVVLLDGKTVGQEAGGFVKGETGKKLTALVVPKDSGSFSYRHVVNNFSVPQAFFNQLPTNLDAVREEISSNLRYQVAIQQIGINQTADSFVYNNRTVYGVAVFESFRKALFAYTENTPPVGP